jgi:hypothetical protein
MQTEVDFTVLITKNTDFWDLPNVNPSLNMGKILPLSLNENSKKQMVREYHQVDED